MVWRHGVRPDGHHAGQPDEARAATITRTPSASGWPAAASRAARSSARPTSWAGASIEDPVHLHDFHATLLHLFGLDHRKLTYRHQGLDVRLTDVAGKVVTKLLA